VVGRSCCCGWCVGPWGARSRRALAGRAHAPCSLAPPSLSQGPSQSAPSPCREPPSLSRATLSAHSPSRDDPLEREWQAAVTGGGPAGRPHCCAVGRAAARGLPPCEGKQPPACTTMQRTHACSACTTSSMGPPACTTSKWSAAAPHPHLEVVDEHARLRCGVRLPRPRAQRPCDPAEAACHSVGGAGRCDVEVAAQPVTVWGARPQCVGGGQVLIGGRSAACHSVGGAATVCGRR